jgi:hypothetical protein
MALEAVDEDLREGIGQDDDDRLTSVSLDDQLAEVMQRPHHLETMLSLGVGLLQVACDLGWPATARMILQDLMLLKLMMMQSSPASSSGAVTGQPGAVATWRPQRLSTLRDVPPDQLEGEEQEVRPSTLEARKPAAVLASARSATHVLLAVPGHSSAAAAGTPASGLSITGMTGDSSSRMPGVEAGSVSGSIPGGERSASLAVSGSAPSSPLLAAIKAKRQAMAAIWDAAAASGLSLLHRAVRSHSAPMVGGGCRQEEEADQLLV